MPDNYTISPILEDPVRVRVINTDSNVENPFDNVTGSYKCRSWTVVPIKESNTFMLVPSCYDDENPELYTNLVPFLVTAGNNKYYIIHYRDIHRTYTAVGKQYDDYDCLYDRWTANQFENLKRLKVIISLIEQYKDMVVVDTKASQSSLSSRCDNVHYEDTPVCYAYIKDVNEETRHFKVDGRLILEKKITISFYIKVDRDYMVNTIKQNYDIITESWENMEVTYEEVNDVDSICTWVYTLKEYYIPEYYQ